MIQNAHFTSAPFPRVSGLFSNANGYVFNIITPLSLALMSLILGVNVTTIQIMPIYAALFFASVILVSNALYHRKFAIIVTLLFSCFFLYLLNDLAAEVNRIIFSYSMFFFFLYTFINAETRKSNSYRILQLFFLSIFVFTYSTDAVSLTLFIIVLFALEAYRTRAVSKLTPAILYCLIVIVLYLFLTDFLKGALTSIVADFSQPIHMNFSFFFSPGVWPGQLVYTPTYGTIDWFFLAYPFVVLATILLLTTSNRLRVLWKAPRTLSMYDEILISFIVFVVGITLSNAVFQIASAGVDYTSLFAWFSPIFVFPIIDGLFKRSHKHLSLGRSLVATDQTKISLKFLAILLIISIGLLGIFNYYRLGVRQGEIVTQQEVVAAAWIGNTQARGLVVTSDLHFLSTYVTINGVNATHFLPVEANITLLEGLYYNVSKSTLAENGIQLYVVSNNMQNLYITEFVGTRTIPSPNLESILSSLEGDKIYDDGTFAALYFSNA